MAGYEIGRVYENNKGKLFLAISKEDLVTQIGGEIQKRRPRAVKPVKRDLSVNVLCERWGIAAEVLDAMTQENFNRELAKQPPPKTKGARRPKGADDHFWHSHRLARISQA